MKPLLILALFLSGGPKAREVKPRVFDTYIPARCITHVTFPKKCADMGDGTHAKCDHVILTYACIAEGLNAEANGSVSKKNFEDVQVDVVRARPKETE